MNTYICRCGLSLNVKMKNGNKCHIKFSNMSDGRSSYSTSNEEIIYGLEHHSEYGKSYWKESSTQDEPVTVASEDEAVTEVAEVKEVEVSCLADAKDYLAKNCGVLRSSMKTKASIIEAAKGHNIEFKGDLS